MILMLSFVMLLYILHIIEVEPLVIIYYSNFLGAKYHVFMLRNFFFHCLSSSSLIHLPTVKKHGNHFELIFYKSNENSFTTVLNTITIIRRLLFQRFRISILRHLTCYTGKQ